MLSPSCLASTGSLVSECEDDQQGRGSEVRRNVLASTVFYFTLRPPASEKRCAIINETIPFQLRHQGYAPSRAMRGRRGHAPNSKGICPHTLRRIPLMEGQIALDKGLIHG